MRAVKLVSPGTLELREVPTPTVGPDDVLSKVAGAGLCHSDLHVLHVPEGSPLFGVTLGQEGAGWVEEVGAGAPAPISCRSSHWRSRASSASRPSPIRWQTSSRPSTTWPPGTCAAAPSSSRETPQVARPTLAQLTLALLHGGEPRRRAVR